MTINKTEKLMKQAHRTIKRLGDDDAYDLATWILHILNKRCYCIWQTYTVDDIKLNMGREPTAAEFLQMQENMGDCFDYITPED